MHKLLVVLKCKKNATSVCTLWSTSNLADFTSSGASIPNRLAKRRSETVRANLMCDVNAVCIREGTT
jgi:hypothetical protein